jgi:hypothetical protein
MRESSASKPARASTHIRRPEPHIAVGYPVCGTPEMPTMSASSDTCGNDDLHRVVCPTRMPTVELDAHSSSAFADGSSRMIRQNKVMLRHVCLSNERLDGWGDDAGIDLVGQNRNGLLWAIRSNPRMRPSSTCPVTGVRAFSFLGGVLRSSASGNSVSSCR